MSGQATPTAPLTPLDYWQQSPKDRLSQFDNIMRCQDGVSNGLWEAHCILLCPLLLDVISHGRDQLHLGKVKIDFPGLPY
ncbi:hypothetical protein DACRYDRAFT_106193 [Dacryopinax primogenitus]|uniref:Uncharacterized protein n=1 Tax=Dacryopinax primogenitus (strain DJM 731) TaxID=1858805 RepID=M5G2U4_DACPD|nr:uncharacterized protein DACRYDRAFT_106193 [Dacryopinax primogenitus]EJU03014.1 hypothetical protein DACRYDRAFT_106193 [Dacryopinax primogenitus]